jgi:hypothetical protein
MLASTATASTRADPANTTLDAVVGAAVTG